MNYILKLINYDFTVVLKYINYFQIIIAHIFLLPQTKHNFMVNVNKTSRYFQEVGKKKITNTPKQILQLPKCAKMQSKWFMEHWCYIQSTCLLNTG